MYTTSKLLMGLQVAVLMTAVALPVQASVNIGAPKTLSGSVVSLHSYVYGTTPITSAPVQVTQTTVATPTTTNVQTSVPSIKISQPNTGRNVVSLKNISSQPSTLPVTTTPAPTTPTAAGIPSVTVLTADEQLMVNSINQERTAAGVKPVQVDLRLASVGRAKANDRTG